MKHAHSTHVTTKSAPQAAAVSRPVAEATPGAGSKDEFVRLAAYCYYEARGRVGGHELDDWLKAEADFERLCRPEAGDAASTGH